MRQMQPVLWTKGVLLSPQHLQLQDRFLQDLLGFRLTAVAPWRWGFARLQLDLEALEDGLVALEDARGIFPDGLAFEIPESDAAPPARPVDDVLEPDAEAGVVYLSIPEWKAGGTNVGMRPGTGARLDAEMVHRRDDTTGDGEKPVLVGRKNLRLVGEEEQTEGLMTLPVAKLRRNEAGDIAVDDDFVPPLVNHAASPHLVSLNRRLVEIMTARSTTLAGTRRQRSEWMAEFTQHDVGSFWLLYTVNSFLPELRHHLEAERGHPLQLFRSWTALAGSLTTFSRDLTPADLPSYDHRDLQGCFEALDGMIRDLLATVVPSTHVSLPLRGTDPHVYAAALDDEEYFSATEMYLALKSQMGGDEMARQVPGLAKASSGDRVDLLVRKARSGVTLRHVTNPPGSLPLKLDYQYFRIDRSGPEWDAVRRSRNIAVYLPSKFADVEGEVILLLPRDGG